MKKIFTLVLTLLLSLSSVKATPDYSISFEEFKKKLEGVFDEVQLHDLRTHLPSDFEIWGYDVGDFSADEEPDIALSVKLKNQREKKVQVFFFVSTDSSFIEVSTIPVTYFEIAIEVGFTIERGICFMTKKEQDHHWFISGYAFRDGSFFLVDRFEVRRQAFGRVHGEEIGYEIYNNYQTLASSESFFDVANGAMFLKTPYYTFPVYRVTRKLFPDFTVTLSDTSAKYFLYGNEFWKGVQDLSFSARLTYDDSSLQCFVRVIDDSLVVRPSLLAAGDHIALWFDLQGNRMNPSEDSTPHFRRDPDDKVMSVVISPGNFRKGRPEVNLLLRTEPTKLQQKGINATSVIATRNSNGYTLEVRMPFSIFDLMQKPTAVGFSLQVIDVDGGAGATTKKSVATSQLRDWDPSSFGVMRFVPDHGAYGEVRNLLVENLLKRIRDVGI